MSYRVIKNRPGKDGILEIPAREDGQPFEWGMRYSSATKLCFADSTSDLCGVLCGEHDYADLSGQDRLIRRIQTAIRLQVAAQAKLVFAAHQNGDWERLTETEKSVLLAPRYEQPWGWSRDLLQQDFWDADVPLLLLTTGYLERPAPIGEPERLWWIDPTTEQSLLESLFECHIIDVFNWEHGAS